MIVSKNNKKSVFTGIVLFSMFALLAYFSVFWR